MLWLIFRRPSGTVCVMVRLPGTLSPANFRHRSAVKRNGANGFNKAKFFPIPLFLLSLFVPPGKLLAVSKPLTSYTCKLTDAQAAALRALMVERNYKFREVPYARFAGEKDKLQVVFYESGKLVLQGKGTQEFIEFVLEPEILKEVKMGYETVLNPELLDARLGVDESGKGDFFGPLCIAGVYVNGTMLEKWKDAGVRDSKNISSDK